MTHSHLDHTGRLPSLIRAGFEGKIYSTAASKDFAEVMLLDSSIFLRRRRRARKNPCSIPRRTSCRRGSTGKGCAITRRSPSGRLLVELCRCRGTSLDPPWWKVESNGRSGCNYESSFRARVLGKYRSGGRMRLGRTEKRRVR